VREDVVRDEEPSGLDLAYGVLAGCTEKVVIT